MVTDPSSEVYVIRSKVTGGILSVNFSEEGHNRTVISLRHSGYHNLDHEIMTIREVVTVLRQKLFDVQYAFAQLTDDYKDYIHSVYSA